MSIEISRRRFIEAGVAAGFLAFLPGCNSAPLFKPAKTYGGNLTWAYPNIYSLDPARLYSQREMQITTAIYDTLLTYNFQDKSVANLACESYKLSDDKLTYIFQLKKDAKFHNGQPVRSQDFKFAFERLSQPSDKMILMNRDLLSAVSGFDEFRDGKADEISGITCPDDFTLSIKLMYPFEQFTLILTHPALVPIIEGSTDTEIARTPVGNGPFIIPDGWNGFSDIKLERYKDYDNQAGLDSIKFEFRTSVADAYRDFQRSEFDIVSVPPSDYKEAAEQFGRSQDGYTITPGAQCCLGKTASVSYLAFNFDNLLLQKEELRQAISMAIDRKGLSDKLFESITQPADDIIPSLVDGYKEGTWPYCAYDLDKAKELVEQVKNTIEKEEKESPSKEKVEKTETDKPLLSFTLIYNEEEASADLMRDIATSIKSIGIDIKLKDLSVDNYVEALYRHEFDIAYTSWTADYPSAEAFLWNIFFSKSSANVGLFNRRSIDKDIDKARAITDYRARLDALKKINIDIANTVPVAPIFFGNLALVGSKTIKQAYINPDSIMRLADVTIN